MNELNNLSEEIKRAFANRFLKYGILIDQAVLNSTCAHIIIYDNWQIKFIEGDNIQGKYLEFYTQRSNHSDTHFRIYQNGYVEELEAVSQGYAYDRTLPGDKEMQHTKYVENNKKIYNSLKEIGLFT